MDKSVIIDAARAMQQIVDKGGKRLTLRELKALTMPRSSWEGFAEVCKIGHQAGVLTMSRVDLPQVYGSIEQTGEISIDNSDFHAVRPTGKWW